RLIFHRAGHDLRMALRDRWGESADAERVGQRNRGGGDLPDRLSRGLHDRRQRRIPRRVRSELNRQEGGERDGVDALQTALELGRGLEDAVLDLDARDDAGMGQAGEPGDQSAGRRTDLVVRLDAGQNEVVRQRAHRRGEEPRDGPDIVGPGIFGRDSDRFVGAFRERLAQHLIDPLRPQAVRDAMVDLPWQSVHAANHQRQYLALLSYLPLKGYRKMWMFSRHVRAIRRQLAGTPGLIGYSLRAKLFRHRFWTLSVWEDDAALTAFVGHEPHRTTM